MKFRKDPLTLESIDTILYSVDATTLKTGGTTMIDMSKIRVLHVNSAGVAYGPPVHQDDLRWEVSEEIAEAVLERDEDAGEVEVGGQRYRWARTAG